MIRTRFILCATYVVGPFGNLDELLAIERFVRTVVLHDQIGMEGALLPLVEWGRSFQPINAAEETERNRFAGRIANTAIRFDVNWYDFFTDRLALAPVSESDITQGCSKHRGL